MMQKQEASIETHNEHNQSFMILIVFNKKALAKSGDFCQCLYSIIEISKGHN